MQRPAAIRAPVPRAALKHVAVLIETSFTYGRELLRGVRQYTAEHEPWSLFIEIRDLSSTPPAWLRSWNGDGILTRTRTAGMAALLERLALPTVELRSLKGEIAFPYVCVQNKTVGQMCAQHFLERGYRHLGVYELQTESFYRERCSSFVEEIETAGFPCHRLHPASNAEKPRQWEKQQTELVAWLEKLPKPIGIMAATDQLGFWLIDACRRAGIAVPDEVAVLGVGNEETLCTSCSPTLSSVRLGGERMGYRACAILDAWMQGRRPPREPVMFAPLGVEVRGSTDSVAVRDPLLSRALRLIRDGACKGYRVEDLLRHVPLSRSTLERGFRAVVGRSPNQELNRVRLQKAAELLVTTDLGLEAIAHRTAFASRHYLCTSFHKAYGMTPGAYRRRGQSPAGPL